MDGPTGRLRSNCRLSGCERPSFSLTSNAVAGPRPKPVAFRMLGHQQKNLSTFARGCVKTYGRDFRP